MLTHPLTQKRIGATKLIAMGGPLVGLGGGEESWAEARAESGAEGEHLWLQKSQKKILMRRQQLTPWTKKYILITARILGNG